MKTYRSLLRFFAPARLPMLFSTVLTIVFNIGTAASFTEAQIIELGFSATRIITGQ